MNYTDCIKPGVRALDQYTVKGKTAPVKLNQNENPFDIPDEIKQKVIARFASEHWNRYPETHPSDLVEAFARRHNWPADGIIVGNGSNELMYTVLMAVAGKGTQVLLPSPSFFLYEKAARILDADVTNVMMNDDLSYNPGRFLETAKLRKPSLIVIVSPNSPTAGSMTIDGVESILKESGSLVLVDEAYIEFSEKRSCFDLLKDHTNLIILRTLSKSFSLAGLRIGYVIAHPEIRNEILKPKIPFTVNRLSAIAAMTLLENMQVIDEHIAIIRKEKAAMWSALKSIPGVTVYPSDTNFFLIRTGRPAPALMDEMLANGVLVRDVSSYPMLEGCLRINVGTPDENKQCLEILRRIVS